MKIQPGLSAIETHVVRGDDLATHWGSEMPVLASPVLIGLLERTCVKATDHLLDSTQTTVGLAFDVLHVSPTSAGCEIQLSAHLESVTRKTLKFHVEAYDEHGLISSGILLRALVKKAAFLKKVKDKDAHLDATQAESSQPAAPMAKGPHQAGDGKRQVVHQENHA